MYSTHSLERRIVGVVTLFIVFGLIMLFSATGVLGLKKYGSEFHYLNQQAAVTLIGLALMGLLSRIPYHFWGKMAPWLLCFQIFLTSLTYVKSLSLSTLGVSRWIKLGPFTFQPSEMAKLTVAIYVAKLIEAHGRGKLPFGKKVLFGLPLMLLLALLYRQPDLGSCILLGTMMAAMLFVAGARPSFMLGLAGLGTALFIASFFGSSYRKRRLLAFLNPWEDPQGHGFQSIQSFLSFYTGKIFGVGVGNGNSKLFYLPEVHTDFIYALIGEELGFVGTLLVLALFAYLGFLLFKVARHAPDTFGRALGCGLAFSFMLQVAINLGGVTGLVPVKGLPLPFISWGRSAILMNLVLMGIVLNINRLTPNKQTTKKASSPKKTRKARVLNRP